MNKDNIIRYLTRHAIPALPHDRLPPEKKQLKLCIVIPCMAESDHILKTLNSLIVDYHRQGEAEVIVVVNNASNAADPVKQDNLVTVELLEKWSHPDTLPVHIIERVRDDHGLEPSTAGVGLARRIGMDEALRRLVKGGPVSRAAIACLDGDATVKPGYIDQLLNQFDRSDQPAGGLCAFEHPMPDDHVLAKGMVSYELWLRYLELGLQYTGSLFAYQSIGSCMVVSAAAYALADGMPLRQAAEDFHFLLKIAKISKGKGLVKLRGAMVYPEARYSGRVPFGTGQAMNRMVSDGLAFYRQVAHPDLFAELKNFFTLFKSSQTVDRMHDQCSSRIALFMDDEKGWDVFEKLYGNYQNPVQLNLACHQWFDGLKIVRFLNRFGKGHRLPLEEALPLLTGWLSMPAVEPDRHLTTDEVLAYWLMYLRKCW